MSTLRGMGVSGVASLISKLINAVAYLWVVSLLSPELMGVVALGLSVYAMFGPFREFGLGPALVSRKELTPTIVSTAYVLRWTLALATAGAGVLIAVVFPYVFDQPQLMLMIMLLTLTFLIEPIGFLSVTMLQREFKFNRLAMADIISVLTMAVVVVISSLLGQPIYSLFLGTVAYMIVRTGTLLYYRRPPDVSAKRDPAERKALFSFGIMLSLSGIVVYAFTNLNVLVLGAIDIAALGLYGFAMLWASAPADIACGAIGRVLLPTYSTLKSDLERLSNAYLKTMKHLFIVALLAFLSLFVIAPLIIEVIYSEEWEEAIPILLALLIYGLVRTLVEPAGTLLVANEKTQLILKANIASLIVMAVLVFPVAWFFGALGCAYLISGAFLVYALSVWYVASKILHLRPGPLLAIAARPIIATVLGILAYVLLSFAVDGVLGAVLTILVVLGVYVGMLFVLARHDLRESVLYAMATLRSPK